MVMAEAGDQVSCDQASAVKNYKRLVTHLGTLLYCHQQLACLDVSISTVFYYLLLADTGNNKIGLLLHNLSTISPLLYRAEIYLLLTCNLP